MDLLKLNLLNNAGLQSTDSTLDLGVEIPKEPEIIVSKATLNAQNKKMLENLETEIEKSEGEKSKKKSVSAKPLIFTIFFIILIASLFYVYKYTDFDHKKYLAQIVSGLKRKTKGIQKNTQEVPKETTQVKQTQGKVVDPAISEKISAENIDLNLITGILELIPNNSYLCDLSIKNKSLSLICIVNDIISGENLKFFFYNHKLSLKPQLFYIEQADENKKYQITALAELIGENKLTTDQLYKNDRQLSAIFTHIAKQVKLASIEPLTISKRDESKIRTAHIVMSGSKNQIMNFFRQLKLANLNIATTGLIFEEQKDDPSMQNLHLKLELIIYPQNI